jgi:hypothetical protein
MNVLKKIVLSCALAGVPTVPTLASELKEQVKCTSEPQSKWMSEAKIRRIFGADKYLVVKFKVSRTNCYEFYAIAHSGQIVEAYYHPISGALVKEERMTPDAAQPRAAPAVAPQSR